ncbi:MAG: DUF4836 family protein, partial [Mediterranea sp.]|nr:DUF4836 family protein [Mediterranea sp.]
MKKSLINRLLVPAAMVVLMASCTGKLSEYTNVIPADALLVVGFRTQSLIDKSGVSDNDKQKLMDAIKSGLNASTAQQIEKFMRDGSTFGLSMKDPVYLFVDGQLSSAAFVVKMDDVERFSKALEVMLPEMSIGPVVEADGYRRFTFKGGICAFNESVLLITAIHGDDDKILSALMKQVKGESIAVNAYFKNVSGKKGDIIFVGQPDALLNQIRRENPQLEGMGLAGPRNSAIIGSLSFEKGRIALQIETASEDKEVRAQLKRQSETFGELNET